MNLIALPPRAVPIPATVPDREALIRSWGFMTEEEGKRLDALEQAQYVLVRIDGMGERWRCGKLDGAGRRVEGCGMKHTHFTSFCIERPFRGLVHGLLAYWTNVGAADPRDLSPRQKSNLAALNPLFTSTPALTTSHPETAHALGTRERDVELGADILGTIDPISPVRARLLAERINFKARRTLIRL